MKDSKDIQIIRGTSSPSIAGIELRCATTRKAFRVIIETTQPSHHYRYRVLQVSKEESVSQNSTISSHKIKILDINISEIEGISTIRCPYCLGGESAVIKCGCGELSCGGGVSNKAGKQYHKCPWCNSVGIINGYIKNLSGGKSPRHEILPGRNNSKQLLKNIDTPMKILQSGTKQIQKP